MLASASRSMVTTAEKIYANFWYRKTLFLPEKVDLTATRHAGSEHIFFSTFKCRTTANSFRIQVMLYVQRFEHNYMSNNTYIHERSFNLNC
jgi:hypothetical protein